MIRSARREKNASTPRPKPMATAAGTEIATSASEFIDSPQYPMTTM